MSDTLENIKHTDKNLVIIIGILIIIILMVCLNTENLKQKTLLDEYNKLTDFLDNHSIFEGYLLEKCDLYWELCAGAHGDDAKKNTIYKEFNMNLFCMIGSWGWDEERLLNRYSFSEIMDDYFIKDFEYWSNEGMSHLKGLYNNSDPEFYDMSMRLGNIIGDNQIIVSFFRSLLANKASFLKKILTKYEITLEYKFLDSMPDSICCVHGITLNFADYFNDSLRTEDSIGTAFSLLFSSELRLQDVFDMHNWIFEKVFNEHVKDKFMSFDSNIFNNELPYSSYIEKIKHDQKMLEKKIRAKSDLPSYIEYESFPINISMATFYQTYMFIILLLNISYCQVNTYRIRLRLMYFKDSKQVLEKRMEMPSFLVHPHNE